MPSCCLPGCYQQPAAIANCLLHSCQFHSYPVSQLPSLTVAYCQLLLTQLPVSQLLLLLLLLTAAAQAITLFHSCRLRGCTVAFFCLIFTVAFFVLFLSLSWSQNNNEFKFCLRVTCAFVVTIITIRTKWTFSFAKLNSQKKNRCSSPPPVRGWWALPRQEAIIKIRIQPRAPIVLRVIKIKIQTL